MGDPSQRSIFPKPPDNIKHRHSTTAFSPQAWHPRNSSHCKQHPEPAGPRRIVPVTLECRSERIPSSRSAVSSMATRVSVFLERKSSPSLAPWRSDIPPSLPIRFSPRLGGSLSSLPPRQRILRVPRQARTPVDMQPLLAFRLAPVCIHPQCAHTLLDAPDRVG